MNSRFLSALFLISFAALLILKNSSSHSDNFFAAVSKTGGGSSVKVIEEINSPGLPLSYENKNEQSVRALFSDFSCLLRTTNHNYQSVMNRQIISGDFFNKEEFENKANVAVLNLKAAFDMFGTSDVVNNKIEIDGKPWRLIGVIDDKDSGNRNVFLPASRFDQNIESIFINLAQTGNMPDEQLIAKLKAAGISEPDYDFSNFGRIKAQSLEIAFAIPEIILLGLLYTFSKKTLPRIKKYNEKLTALRAKLYFSDILKYERKTICMLTIAIILLALQLCGSLLLFLDLSGKFLLASDLFSTYAENFFMLYCS